MAHRIRALALSLALIVTAAPVAPAAAVGEVGYRGHSYAGFDAESAGGGITGQKPESKLWHHAGTWWAAMLSPAQQGAHTIHRLDGVTWVDTGTVIDPRPRTKEDVLSLGSTLYVLSRSPSADGASALRRFTFDGTGYVLDPGFPVDAPGSGAETGTIARDGTGTLWITYVRNQVVFVARTVGDDTAWGLPYVMPFDEANVDGDDISAVIAFTDATGPAIGVMWSNQRDDRQYFAVHRDGAGDDAASWSLETALQGPNEADDHINLKTFEGRVYAVVKTSATDAAQPLIRLLERSADGTWTKHPVATEDENNTRPITLLSIDPVQREIYVFMTIGEGAGARGIVYKKSPMNGIGFPQDATTFIQGALGETIDDATSTKQNVDLASGIVVIASDGSHYWHNRLGGPNSAPVALDATTQVVSGAAATVTLQGRDAETCELGFTIVTPPAHGSLGAVQDAACSTGSPNADSAVVGYTSAPGFVGTDQFTFRVGDGVATSTTATVTITVNAPGSGGVVSLRSASYAANTGTASLTIPLPAGTSAGDLLLASLDVRGTRTVATPAGWTLLRNDTSGTSMRKVTYYRVADAGEPAAYTWTFSGSAAGSGGIHAYLGVDPAAPIEAHAGQGLSKTNQIAAPSVSVAAAGGMLVGLYGMAITTTIAPPSGFTERGEASVTVGQYTISSEGADRAITEPGASGPQVAVAGTSWPSIGQLVALRPAQ